MNEKILLNVSLFRLTSKRILAINGKLIKSIQF